MQIGKPFALIEKEGLAFSYVLGFNTTDVPREQAAHASCLFLINPGAPGAIQVPSRCLVLLWGHGGQSNVTEGCVMCGTHKRGHREYVHAICLLSSPAAFFATLSPPSFL
mmetsp:Transcript_14257/g.32974  ORF Transcript_14257/g.32974 Transcript_14257/m.32974 type:complete len:110 (+) Transcript_14257:1363-1692(+)